MLMDKQDEKRALRRTIRRMERELPDQYRADASRRIARILLASKLYHDAEIISCFVGTRHEIDTGEILNHALSKSNGKTLCVPLCVGPGVAQMRRIDSLEQLSAGMMGILEPGPDTPEIPPERIDFIILPCLSCDLHGRRLGYGGGYYDRFLTRYHGELVLLCRERLILPEIPFESHDRLAPLILTERGFYKIS